jgi:hypothetical protein
VTPAATPLMSYFDLFMTFFFLHSGPCISDWLFLAGRCCLAAVTCTIVLGSHCFLSSCRVPHIDFTAFVQKHYWQGRLIARETATETVMTYQHEWLGRLSQMIVAMSHGSTARQWTAGLGGQ